jgi:hypothetical protein
VRVMGVFALMSAAAALAGCASTGPAVNTNTKTPGKIHPQNGRMLQFEFEKASGSGDVRAFDAVSGEYFKGQYVGNARLHLTGDKGGALTCTMKIEAAANPHGTGQCEDNKGGAYQLQF